MPAITDKNKSKQLIVRRHPEYYRAVQRSRWLLDTLVADEAYRDAVYGTDKYGLPMRNLMRLSQELPLVDPDSVPPWETHPAGSPFGSVLAETEIRDAAHEMYEIRRARTPIPQFLPQFIEKILGKIYKRQIKRTGPKYVMNWITNVDGRQTSLDEWMRDTVAPLICTLGMLDVAFDHPAPHPGEPNIFGPDLDPKGCIPSLILPENMLWWRKDYTGFHYIECIVRETVYDLEDNIYVYQYRHWTWEDWALYDAEGELKSEGIHYYNVVPIVRLYDRKDFRYDDVPRSRFWGVADKSRAYYNEESELIANDTIHNCPLLQGPGDDSSSMSDATNSDVPIGRNLILKKIVDRNGNHVGYEYVDMPQEPNKFMMQRLYHLQARMESEAGLTRSTGAVGVGGDASMVAQSGISKAYDQVEGNDYLAGISRMLGTNDYAIMYMAMIVLSDGGAPLADIEALSANYPTRFNLLSFDQISLVSTSIQEFMAGSVGEIPEGDKQTLKLMYRELHPDLDPEAMQEIERQIDEYVDRKALEWKNKPVAPNVQPEATGQAPAGPPASSLAAAGSATIDSQPS